MPKLKVKYKAQNVIAKGWKVSKHESWLNGRSKTLSKEAKNDVSDSFNDAKLAV